MKCSEGASRAYPASRLIMLILRIGIREDAKSKSKRKDNCQDPRFLTRRHELVNVISTVLGIRGGNLNLLRGVM